MQTTKKGRKKQLFKWLAGAVLSLTTVQHTSARETGSNTEIKTGIASWYHDKFQGKKTATGETFSQKQMTCASNHFPLGTWLKVTNIKNGKAVIVRVNDRMHARMKRVVDLTREAARTIGIERSGIGKVMVESFGIVKPQPIL